MEYIKASTKPTTAFIGTKYIGTERLGRPLTAPESRDLAALLRKHDFAGASMIALRYAFRLTGIKAAAQDLQGRANLRLVVHGWDPTEVPLPKRLCRLVWSEHTHTLSEDARRRKAEEGFLRNQELDNSTGGAPSVHDFAERLESEQQEEAHGKRCIEALRNEFIATDDTINLLWVEYSLAGVEEPAEMARLSGFEPEDFYRAADRRTRFTNKLLAAQRGANDKSANDKEGD